MRLPGLQKAKVDLYCLLLDLVPSEITDLEVEIMYILSRDKEVLQFVKQKPEGEKINGS